MGIIQIWSILTFLVDWSWKRFLSQSITGMIRFLTTLQFMVKMINCLKKPLLKTTLASQEKAIMMKSSMVYLKELMVSRTMSNGLAKPCLMSDLKGKLPFFMKILSLFSARFLVLLKEPAMLNSEDVLKMRSSFSLAFLLEKSNTHIVLKIGAPLYNKCFTDIPLLILALTEALLIFKQNLFGRSEHENSCSFVILMIFCKTFYFYIDHDKLIHLAGGSPRSP